MTATREGPGAEALAAVDTPALAGRRRRLLSEKRSLLRRSRHWQDTADRALAQVRELELAVAAVDLKLRGLET